MAQKNKKYFNVESVKLKNQLYFYFVKYSYVFFVLSFYIYYLNVKVLSLLLVAVSVVFMFLRLTRFSEMKAIYDILALELSSSSIILDCGNGDYQVSFSKVEYFRFDFHDNAKNYNVLIRIKSTEQVEWPLELYQGYYFRIPNHFDEDLFYIFSQNSKLRDLCRNYDEAASFLEYEKELEIIQD